MDKRMVEREGEIGYNRERETGGGTGAEKGIGERAVRWRIFKREKEEIV